MTTTLGQQIRIARVRQGLNQKALKERVGISQKYLSDIEQNKVTPRVDILVRLAKALNVSTDFLLLGDEKVSV